MSHPQGNTVPVMIVGAGPVGLLLALQLQRFGIPHRLIDKRLQRQPFSKAFAIHSRSMEVLENLGLLDALLQRAVQVRQMNIYSDRRRLITYDLGQLDVPHPFTASIPQNAVEEILEDRYLQAGGCVERGIELHSLVQDESTVRATLQDAQGARQEVACELLAGCDGGQSAVRTMAGIAFDGGRYPRPYIIADGTLAWSGDNASGHVFTSGDGYMMLFPLPEGRHRVVIDCEDPSLTSDLLSVEQVNLRLAERGFADITLSDPIWLSVATFQHRLAGDYRSGRIFLAGDACHLHSPIGGQGLNTGFQDAWNLSWKIAHTLKYGAAPALLDSYPGERRPVAQTVLKNTSQQMRMLNMRNPIMRLLRDAVVPHLATTRRFQERIVKQATGFQIDYQDSLQPAPASTAERRGLAVGQRMPDARLKAQGGASLRLFDLLKGTHYSLLVFTGLVRDGNTGPDLIDQALSSAGWPAPFLRAYLLRSPAMAASAAARSISARYDIADDLPAQLGMARGGFLLVRPDGYLALHCQLTEVERLHAYFERFYPDTERSRQPQAATAELVAD